MKKIVGTIAAALIAVSAFADVGIGSWGRGIWEPAYYDDADGKVKSWTGTSWSGSVREGISIHGETESIGFNIDMNADNIGSASNYVGFGDTAYWWVKPFSMLEVKVGRVQDDTGRGNLGYGLFNWRRIGQGWTGEDVTFTRFGNGTGGQADGAIVKFTPIENLWAIAAFNFADGDEAKYVYTQKAQYGIGYNINGVGLVRAQFIGAANAKDKDGTTIANGNFEVAFDLTALDNLYLTVGAKIPMGLAAVSAYKNTGYMGPSNRIKVAAGANFTMDAITFHAYAVANLPNTVSYETGIAGYKVKYDITNCANVEFGVGADIDLGNGLGINADVRFATAHDYNAVVKSPNTDARTGCIRDSASGFSFLVGLTKNVSGGMFGIGFEGATSNVLSGNDEVGRLDWHVPFVISAAF